jgi:hypothetical protein
MPSQQVKVTTVGNSQPIYIGLKNFATAGVGLQVAITGSITANVQVSGDPNVGPNNPPTNWINHDVLAALAASALGNLAFPLTAVRLNVSVVSGGTAILNVVQAEF